MQWHRAYLLAVSWGVLSSSSSNVVNAFQPLTAAKRTALPTGSTRTKLGVGGMGWDNENYLNALGQGDDALSKANEEYEALSRFGRRPIRNSADDEYQDGGPMTGPSSGTDDDALPTGDVMGAVLTDEMKAQMRAAHDNPNEETSQGGSLFREMMARAQQGATLSSSTPPQVPQYVPPPPPPPPALSAPTIATADLDSLTVEQQAELFRQMMANQQQQQGSLPVTPSPAVIDPMSLPRRSTPADNKRPGRNRDADTIVNSSDVYFAQLKLDSTIRNYARYGGDDDKANQVFADPKVHEIKVHVNPYLEEMRKKEQQLLETAADEMLVADGSFDGGPAVDKPKNYAGPSYKEKLMQRKQQHKQPSSPSMPATAAQADSPDSVVAATPPATPASSSQTPSTFLSPPPKSADSVAATVAPPAPVPQVSSPSASEAGRASAKDYADNEDDVRGDIRTFMGLLLKHRGGPGFGSGRLKTEAERERFESLSNDLLSHLKREALQSLPSSSSSAPKDAVMPHSNHVVSSSSSPSSPMTPQSPLTAPSTSFSAPTTPSGSATSEIPDANRVQGMITCIEGGIQMYRNSPVELRESVLSIFRAALLSAVNTVTEILTPGAPAVPPPPPQSSSSGPQDKDQRINGMISLIEGAIVMYKNSPPELHSSILVTLRGALLAGIGTLNGVIAENEVQNVQAYQSASPLVGTATPSATASPPTKREFYDVIPATQATSFGEQEGEKAPKVIEDGNARFFEQLHDKLQQAKGSGTMGLRTDMDATTAADLADDLAKMRKLLVKELEDGVPNSASPPSSSPGATSAPTSASSKYQEMLAKARAEKEGLQ